MSDRTPADTKKNTDKQAFLQAFADLGVVRYACNAANIGRSTVYEWRNDDPDFAAAWDAAREEACDRLEHEARRRAIEGTDKPVYQGGQKVGAIREYSDTLLIFLLKDARPHIYRDRWTPADSPGRPHSSDASLESLMARFEGFVASEAAQAYLAGRVDAEEEQPAT